MQNDPDYEKSWNHCDDYSVLNNPVSYIEVAKRHISEKQKCRISFSIIYATSPCTCIVFCRA
jgi:hypothetical protein